MQELHTVHRRVVSGCQKLLLLPPAAPIGSLAPGRPFAAGSQSPTSIPRPGFGSREGSPEDPPAPGVKKARAPPGALPRSLQSSYAADKPRRLGFAFMRAIMRVGT